MPESKFKTRKEKGLFTMIVYKKTTIQMLKMSKWVDKYYDE